MAKTISATAENTLARARTAVAMPLSALCGPSRSESSTELLLHGRTGDPASVDYRVMGDQTGFERNPGGSGGVSRRTRGHRGGLLVTQRVFVPNVKTRLDMMRRRGY